MEWPPLAGKHPRWLDPLSQSLAALPAPPKGELFAICRSARIKLPLSGTTSPGRGKMAKPERGTAGERSEPERVGVLSAKPSGFD